MRFAKNKFYFFIFLFIVFSINGEAIPFKQDLNKNKSKASILPAHDQHKSELVQLEGVLSASFRLTENTTDFFREVENANPLFQNMFDERLLFSQQWFAHYTTKWQNRKHAAPVYVRFRSLLI